MGRHADPADRSFLRSVLRAFAGGVAALVVTFGVTALLTVIGRDSGRSPAAVMAPTELPAPPTQAVEPPEPESESPSPSPSPTPQPTEAPAESATDDPAAVTVQVLDAVGTGTGAQAAAAALEELGYTVVVVNPTPRRVEVTTVLASSGQRAAAEQLRERDPRFAQVDDNDAFDSSVDLHVLVGPDFQP